MGPKGAKTALVVIAILIGIIVALVTGILIRSGGGNVSSATLSGGGAFAAAVALVHREVSRSRTMKFERLAGIANFLFPPDHRI